MLACGLYSPSSGRSEWRPSCRTLFDFYVEKSTPQSSPLTVICNRRFRPPHHSPVKHTRLTISFMAGTCVAFRDARNTMPALTVRTCRNPPRTHTHLSGSVRQLRFIGVRKHCRKYHMDWLKRCDELPNKKRRCATRYCRPMEREWRLLAETSPQDELRQNEHSSSPQPDAREMPESSSDVLLGDLFDVSWFCN